MCLRVFGDRACVNRAVGDRACVNRVVGDRACVNGAVGDSMIIYIYIRIYIYVHICVFSSHSICSHLHHSCAHLTGVPATLEHLRGTP